MSEKHIGHAWRWREIGRFASGRYQRIDWQEIARLAKFDGAFSAIAETLDTGAPDTFAHVSIEDDASIAYTQSAEKGERDIQTRTRPGRFLARYFGEKLTAPEISAFAAAFATLYAPVKFKLAKTPDDIVAVYAVGPRSCMRGDDAVRVYGAGDLAIAYLGDKASEVTARAIVWPERMIYGRAYGDEIRLTDALDRAGYTYANAGEAWHGARLLRVEVGEYSFACPYVDMAYAVEDCGEYLRLAPHGFDCRTQSGVVGEAPYTCAACDTGLEADNAHSCEASDSVYCEDCFSERFSYCDSCDNYADADDFHLVNPDTRRETYVCDDCVRNASDIYTCEDCPSGRDRWTDDYIRIVADCAYCEEHAQAHVECEECNADAGADAAEVAGRMLCTDCARNVAECAECGDEFDTRGAHRRYCDACGEGSIMLAPRGAIARPSAPRPYYGPPIIGERPDGAPTRYQRGDAFAVAFDAAASTGPCMMARVLTVDREGRVRSIVTPWGVWTAPLGFRPAGAGVPRTPEILAPAWHEAIGARFDTRGAAADAMRPHRTGGAW